MIKRLLAIMLCIALAMLPGAAEEADLSGLRLTFDQITVTVGEETFAPELSICLDEAYTEQGWFGSFFVGLGSDKLLPVQAKMVEEGMAVRLGNSSVYCFAPEMLGLEEMVETGEEIPTASEVAFGFVEYLDSFEEDSFELEPLELLAWLEGALYLEAGSLRQCTSDDMLPTITAERDSHLGYGMGRRGYTIAVDDMYFTLRPSEQRVTLSFYGSSLIIGADDSIQCSITDGVNYEGYMNQSISLTFKYLPQEDGSSTYSFMLKIHEYYQEETYRALSCDTQISVIGSSDAAGMHDAKVTFIEDYDGITDLSASMHVSIAPAQVEDGIAGQTPIMIESETDSGMNSITFAAMGLFSDIERLLNDASVSGMVEAYNAQSEEYNEIFWYDYYKYYTVDFEVPEFGWMPDGVQLSSVDVTEDGVQYEYIVGESGMLHIDMTESDEEGQVQSGESEEQPALVCTAEESSFTASIVENGVETRIYSEDVVLTEAEVQQILDGRIWVGEGYDDGTNMSM